MLSIILIFSISILFSYCKYDNYIIATFEVKTTFIKDIISSYENFYDWSYSEMDG